MHHDDASYFYYHNQLIIPYRCVDGARAVRVARVRDVDDAPAGISSELLSSLRCSPAHSPVCLPTNVWMNIWLPYGLGP